MIEAIDEALKQFLIREVPIVNGEVDLQFDQPKREWSARVSRPTLNVFLYDMREIQKLRQVQPMWETELNQDGSATQHRKPVRVDLHYMITAWAAEPEDEHRLLSRVLMALFRYSSLPEAVLPESLRNQKMAIPLLVAQYTDLTKPMDIWNVIDNEMRPALSLMVTLSVDPYVPLSVPLVRARDLRIGMPGRVGEDGARQLAAAPDRFWTIGGRLSSAQGLDLGILNLRIVERDQTVVLQPDGRFAIGGLAEGSYTLEITTGYQREVVRRFTLTVPGNDILLEVP